MEGIQIWCALHAPLPLSNNEILKAKPREKDFTPHDGDGLFLLVKPPVKNSGASVINDREAAAAQI
jgi:hypothetical protein